MTRKEGDARRFAAEAGGADLLIAAGGDGTLNEVVHGLMDLSKAARPALGVVPLGTANDFAAGCGIPRDPEQALALCLEGQRVPIDVGKANEHWFLNAASVGFGAAVTATTPPELKRLAWPCRVHCDGCNSRGERPSLSWKAHLARSRNHRQRSSSDRR